jgi:hypothetical protein
MHSNQSWVFTSPAGWNISPAHAAGLSPALFYAGWNISPALLTNGWNISPSHAAGLSPFYFIYYLFFSLFLCVFFIIYLYFFKKKLIFPRIYLRHLD